MEEKDIIQEEDSIVTFVDENGEEIGRAHV